MTAEPEKRKVLKGYFDSLIKYQLDHLDLLNNIRKAHEKNPAVEMKIVPTKEMVTTTKPTTFSSVTMLPQTTPNNPFANVSLIIPSSSSSSLIDPTSSSSTSPSTKKKVSVAKKTTVTKSKTWILQPQKVQKRLPRKVPKAKQIVPTKWDVVTFTHKYQNEHYLQLIADYSVLYRDAPDFEAKHRICLLLMDKVHCGGDGTKGR